MRKPAPYSPKNRPGQAGPLIVGALCFAGLIACAGLLMSRQSPAPAVPPVAALETTEEVAEQPKPQLPADEPMLVALAEEPAAPAEKAKPNPAEQVQAYLAAGEFGAAADLATETDGITREELMSRVFHAQVEAGEANGPQAILSQATGSSSQRGERMFPRREPLGGGMMADFDSLIELIMQETEGPWLEEDGIGGTISEFEAGIRVDPDGVLYREARKETTGRLAGLGIRAREAALNEDMARPSDLRLVSLTRLEREVARRLSAGEPVVESMKQLAGLSQIRYVFIYPEEGEIVIGGPAEGWSYNEYGMPVGTDSGRPTLQLDDLVTVLRTFSPDGMRIFGCSIDPKPENIKAVQEYASASQAKGPLSPAGVKGWAKRIGDLLGHQDITVYGVPAGSRVARVLVEADYRMKLIGVGRMDGGTHIPSYFDLLGREPALASGGLDALRWWLTMKYDEVLHSEDRSAFEVRGSSVLCQSENQFLSDSGQRSSTGQAEPINQLFASNFTKHYQELAERDPIFADLQGVFDLALVAALIHRDQLDERTEWDRGVFATNGAYRPATYPVPKEVESVVNHRVYNGKDVVLQVAGGVRADLASILDDGTVRKTAPRLESVAGRFQADELPAGRWWWDAR